MTSPSTHPSPSRRVRRSRGAVPPGPVTAHDDVEGLNARPGEQRAVDPLDIFTGLAAVCVPVFCDGLHLDLACAADGALHVSYPRDDGNAQGASAAEPRGVDGNLTPAGDVAECSSGAGRVVIAVRSESIAGESPIAGTVTCTWTDPTRPTEVDAVIARLLADQAVAKVRVACLASALDEQRVRAANLAEALATNREIGQAIGILMATDRLTSTQAFDLLRTASQHSHRKLRDIAADVVETGALTGTQQDTAALSLESA